MKKDKTYTFSPSTMAKSGEVNQNFDDAMQGINDIITMPMMSILRNGIINSAMEVWQRAVSFTGATGQRYTADRWCTFHDSASSKVERIATDDANGNYHMRWSLLAGAVSGCTRRLWQQMPTKHATRYAGKKVTISFRARAGAAYSGTGNAPGSFPNIYGGQANGLGVALWTGTGADEAFNCSTGFPTGNVLKSNTAVNLTTSWADYSVVIPTALAAGIKEICTMIYAPINPSTAVANDYFDIKDIRINIGDEPLQFQPKGFLEDLRECLPFYEKSYEYDVVPGTAAAQGGLHISTETTMSVLNAQRVVMGYQPHWTVEKYKVPTIVPYALASGAANQWYYGGAARNASAVSAGDKKMFWVTNATGGSISTVSGTECHGHWTSEAEL